MEGPPLVNHLPLHPFLGIPRLPVCLVGQRLNCPLAGHGLHFNPSNKDLYMYSVGHHTRVRLDDHEADIRPRSILIFNIMPLFCSLINCYISLIPR